MLSEERRRYIVDMLQREGKVVASELSAQLDMSEDTIRRDLRELSRAGLRQRVHGGALPRSHSDPRYSVRQRAMIEGAVEVVAVLTGDKLGTVGPLVVGPMTDVTTIVTKRIVPKELLEPYRQLRIDLVLA